MKKFCAILFSFVLVLIIALPVAAEGESSTLADNAPSLTAPAAYVVNLDTNIVVYEKNSETPLSAASLTKLMTTLLLLENYQDQLDSISLTAPSYVYDLIWEQSTNASSADIRRGETQSLRNLLYAMLLPSGNEAAYIVADYMGGGSIDNFVAMMNDEAKAVGCTGTTFVDPCGLNPNNITTARDAYLILRALTAYDVFSTVVGTPSYDMGTNDRWDLYHPDHRQAHHQQQLPPRLHQRRQDRQPGRVAELCRMAQPGRRELHQHPAERALRR